MKFSIHEANLERLEKKMIRIKNKCKKYGCDFVYEVVGEEYKDVVTEEGETVKTRFVIVEAEGKAIINNWEFVAAVDATGKGNIINKAIDVEVPERYYTMKLVCEHCQKKVARKHTFIIRNTETNEFKMVGRSCLKDYTCGMDAELVAGYIAMFQEMLEGENVSGVGRNERYYETKEFLKYAVETIRHYGFVKSGETDSTKSKVIDFLAYVKGWKFFLSRDEIRKIENEIETKGIDFDRPENMDEVERMLAWIAEQTEDSNYIHNLKVACSLEYITFKYFGLLASLFPTYNKDLEKQAQIKREQENKAKSDFVGNVGDRVEINVKDFLVVTGWQTQWGYTVIYKIIDTDDNVFTWKTSSSIPGNVKTIKGTVKEHKEYGGEKQTELTRCKCS